MPKTIVEDTRPIRSICFADDSAYTVGDITGTTKIEPHYECGEMATVRVPARMVVIVYENQPEVSE